MGNAVTVVPYADEDSGLFSKFSHLTKSSTKNDFHGDEFRFISLTALKKHCEFPKCPLDNQRTKLLSRRELLGSFVVFISHAWLRGSPVMQGYNGARHPDTEDNEKYKLAVEALIKIHRIYAPTFEDIWIWLDYGCVDQNCNPADSYGILSDVIYLSDCLLTPIVDENADKWSYSSTPTSSFDALSDYRSESFQRGSFAYLNRAWCRLEMFFATQLPVKNTGPRKDVSKEMQLFTLNGIRPHFLFGSKESLEATDPVLVNPMTKDMMNAYDPRRGQLTCPSDEPLIQKLVEGELTLLMNSCKPCYVGERNNLLQKHGRGMTVEENGDVYEGEYYLSKKHGQGKMKWSNGDVYDGQWVQNQMQGIGRLEYCDGEVYEGGWRGDLRHGDGKLYLIDGSEYEGQMLDGRMTGHGIYMYPDDSRYEGDFVDGVREGYGVMIYGNLDVYRGQFAKGNLHGKGTYRDYKGNEYTGACMCKACCRVVLYIYMYMCVSLFIHLRVCLCLCVIIAAFVLFRRLV